MKPGILLSFLSAVAALHVSPNAVSFKTFKKQSLQKSVLQENNLRRRSVLSKRQNSGVVDQDISQAVLKQLYFVNITIGTPPQEIAIQLDTGSSDLWVPAPTSTGCVEQGCPGGTFDASSSSSYDFVADGFSICYLDKTCAEGEYATETVRLSSGSAVLEKIIIGYGVNATTTEGLMGVGYANAESHIIQGGATESYPNIVEELVLQGFIGTKTYSLWLNDYSSSEGEILFGGVDTEKFVGDLTILDILQPPEGPIITFSVSLTNIGATIDTDQFEIDADSAALLSSLPSVLDSGTSLTLVPKQIFDAVGVMFGATYEPDFEIYYFPDCSLSEYPGTVDFSFGSGLINVPFNEFIIPLYLKDGSTLTTNDGTQICQLGIAAGPEDQVILGDTFLRSAYVVYDLDNNQIGIANTNFNSTTTNVIALQSDAIPSGTTASGTPTSVAGATNTNYTRQQQTAIATTATFGSGATTSANNGIEGSLRATGTRRPSNSATANGNSSSGAKSAFVMPSRFVGLFAFIIFASSGVFLI